MKHFDPSGTGDRTGTCVQVISWRLFTLAFSGAGVYLKDMECWVAQTDVCRALAVASKTTASAKEKSVSQRTYTRKADWWFGQLGSETGWDTVRGGGGGRYGVAVKGVVSWWTLRLLCVTALKQVSACSCRRTKADRFPKAMVWQF